MKKILSLLALAILTIGLMGSCSKINERIDDLDKRINNLENDKIASVEQQIAAINQSIADLGTIRTNIQTLMDAKEAQGEDITALKAANTTLEGKVADLETYVNTKLGKFATTEWVNATFATLAKQAEIITDITKLRQDLAGLDAELDQAIEDLDSSLKAWVNEQLSAYSTTAQMEAKIKALQDQIDALKTDIETDKPDIAKLEAGLDQLEQDLAATKASVKTAYEKAIKDALESNNGYITEKIKRAISSANGSISSLSSRVGTLETQVEALRGDVDALKGMIQSVTIIPAYNDGSVKADETGIVYINCIISPASAVSSLTKANFTVLVNKDGAITPFSITGFDKDGSKGTVSLNVSVAIDNSTTVAVNVNNGISDYTTGFVSVYVDPGSCIAAGTMITMENGEQKAVEKLELGDAIRTFDHETGEVSSSKVCFIMSNKNVAGAFTLTFEDGISVCVIEEHGFYDREEQKYAFINPRNAKDYIGHHFYDADNERWLELKSCEVLPGSVDAYAIVTSRHLNHTSNGMLSMCDGTIEILANLFEYDNQMRFDTVKKNGDIEKYGLTPKEKVLEYEGFIESDYENYNLQYLDIAIGKGLTSWELVQAFSDYCVANGIF
mgnify:CR=1 FL=1